MELTCVTCRTRPGLASWQRADAEIDKAWQARNTDGSQRGFGAALFPSFARSLTGLVAVLEH